MAKEVKQKRCKYSKCDKFFTPKYSSLQETCYDPKCAHGYAQEKQELKNLKDFERAKKAMADDNITTYLQNAINTIVRLIDRGHECISSGTPYYHYRVAAGHYFGVQAHGSLRYNLLNIYAQSFSDNDKKGGKGSDYSVRLKTVFGAEVRDEIEWLLIKYPRLDLRPPEMRKALVIARQIIKELEQVDIVFSTEYRIEVRRKLNERIGIYK